MSEPKWTEAGMRRQIFEKVASLTGQALDDTLEYLTRQEVALSSRGGSEVALTAADIESCRITGSSTADLLAYKTQIKADEDLIKSIPQEEIAVLRSFVGWDPKAIAQEWREKKRYRRQLAEEQAQARLIAGR